jgi:hypothetical protein
MGPRSSKPAAKKAPPGGQITAQDKAVLDLKNARDRLKKYTARLHEDEKRLQERALKCMKAGNKSNALLLMKVKKKKAQEAESVEKQLLSVYSMVSTIEWETQQMDVIKALTAGKDALKAMHEQMSVDDVLDLMDDVQENLEVQDRINEAFSRGSSLSDEEELEEELAALQKDMEGAEGAGKMKVDVPSMPEVPTEKPLVLPVVPTTEIREREEEAPKEGERVAALA